MQPTNSRKKICFVVSSEMTVNAFLLSHLRALSDLYDVTVITNTKTPNFLKEKGITANVIPLHIERRVHLVSDFKSLLSLVRIIKKNQFSSVHSVTPKAGLLSMLAAWVIGVPLRIHTFTGQVWANKSGFKRWGLKFVDQFFSSLATHCIIDSPSQRDFLTAEKVVKPEKCTVFGEGSISGVNLNKFKPNTSKRRSIRHELGISDDAILCLFIGRLNHDKGVLDIAKAFQNAQSKLENKKAIFLFVGSDEEGMIDQVKALDNFNDSRTLFLGHTNKPQDYMAAGDFLCLPSYREGFGSVIIEAAAVGIPAMASSIYGIVDAIKDGKTGLLHLPGDISDIQAKLIRLISDNNLRIELGCAAQKRAKAVFDSEGITEAWVNFYQKELPC